MNVVTGEDVQTKKQSGKETKRKQGESLQRRRGGYAEPSAVEMPPRDRNGRPLDAEETEDTKRVTVWTTRRESKAMTAARRELTEVASEEMLDPCVVLFCQEIASRRRCETKKTRRRRKEEGINY